MTKLRFDTDCDGTPDEGTLFATQKIPRMVIQGITFETAPDNGTGDSKTFWAENYHQQCSDDCETTTPPPHQPARENYELPDPFSMGASSALNDEMMGPGAGGDFSVFGAETDGPICPDHVAINLYVYGLDDTSSGCTSYVEAPGVSYNVLVSTIFENSTLAPAGPGPQINRNRNGATLFLYSDVTTPMSVSLDDEDTTMESIISLHSPPHSVDVHNASRSYEHRVGLSDPSARTRCRVVADFRLCLSERDAKAAGLGRSGSRSR